MEPESLITENLSAFTISLQEKINQINNHVDTSDSSVLYTSIDTTHTKEVEEDQSTILPEKSKINIGPSQLQAVRVKNGKGAVQETNSKKKGPKKSQNEKVKNHPLQRKSY